MQTDSLRFFSGINARGTQLFFAARNAQAQRRMKKKTPDFRDWEDLSAEQICIELNPFVGPYFVSLVPGEFADRPCATVLQFPEEAMRNGE